MNDEELNHYVRECYSLDIIVRLEEEINVIKRKLQILKKYIKQKG